MTVYVSKGTEQEWHGVHRSETHMHAVCKCVQSKYATFVNITFNLLQVEFTNIAHVNQLVPLIHQSVN